jgi:hypothetical protein
MEQSDREIIIRAMPDEVIIDLLTFIGYSIEVIDRDDERYFIVIDPEDDAGKPVEIDGESLRTLLIDRLRAAESG